MRDWGKDHPKIKCIWGKDRIFGGKGVIEAPDDYDGDDFIMTPFSHVEYEEFTNKHMGWGTFALYSKYHTDPDGYEFMEGDFC